MCIQDRQANQLIAAIMVNVAIGLHNAVSCALRLAETEIQHVRLVVVVAPHMAIRQLKKLWDKTGVYQSRAWLFSSICGEEQWSCQAAALSET